MPRTSCFEKRYVCKANAVPRKASKAIINFEI